MRFVLMFAFFANIYGVMAQPLPTQEEYDALLQFYTATGGQNWINNTGWKDADPNVVQSVGGWYGVSTSSDGHVTSLILNANNLSGLLPVEIGHLWMIADLDLHNNNLSGNLDEIANLNNLVNLDLSSNQLTGSIPSGLGNLNRFQTLNLSNNQLSGSIPESLGNLPEIILINLSKNQLSGTLPELPLLTKIQTLALSSNRITGFIPVSYGNFSNLTFLDLSLNSISGNIPSSIQNLSQLNYLDLSSNAVTGTIPDVLGNLAELVTLNLAQNQIIGNIPASLGSISTLRSLVLSNNQLSGPIPSQLGNLIQLRNLALNNNQLTGSIPSSFGGLVNLSYFILNTNLLTGEIPSSLGNLSTIRDLFLGHNKLTGSIPESLGNLNTLQRLDLQANSLTGDIPLSFAGLSSLQNLFLEDNHLRGALPTSLSSLTIAEIRNNNFTFADFLGLKRTMSGSGYLLYAPEDSVDVKKTIAVSMGSSISLTSEIDRNTSPQSLYQWFKFERGARIALTPAPSPTGYSYTLPTVAPENDGTQYYYTITNPDAPDLILTSRIQTLHVVGGCQSTIEDEYSALIGLYNSTNGNERWTNTTGWRDADPNTVQSVQDWFGVTTDENGFVVSLKLRNNNLSGTLPSNIGNFCKLRELDLSSNHLSGNLPGSLGSLSALNTLNLSENTFSGGLPTELGDLSNLKQLALNNNNFTNGIPSSFGNLRRLRSLALHSCPTLGGSIPASLGNLDSLEQLLVNESNLSGALPSELGNMKSLTTFWSHGNKLSGPIPSEFGGLTQLRQLFLSGNQTLSGSIPEQLGSLTSLEYLFLDANQLTGPIPSTFGNMTNLVRLRLGGNLLTGSIPEEIGNLKNLQILDVQHNQLSGSLPFSLGNLTRLEQLVLEENQLSGDVPPSFQNLTNLVSLNIYNNRLSGDLPGTAPGLQVAQIQNNRFTFSNLLPLRGIIPSDGFFSYAPQDSVDIIKIISAAAGSSLRLTTDIDRTTSPPSLYQWFKIVNGVGVPLMQSPSETGYSYEGAAITTADHGTQYYYQITNPSAPGLTLTSRLQIINISGSECQSTLEQEYHALMDLYNSTNGAEWSNNEGWRDADPNVVQSLQGWYGLTTDNEGHVTSLNLGFNNNLNGTLPGTLGNLCRLERIFIESNLNLTGSIPKEIGQLSSLRELDLNYNSLSGTIPPELGNLSQLRFLSLVSNQITGGLPVTLGNLSKLEIMDMSNCPLGGSIPSSFEGLDSLSFLSLSSCGLVGSIPAEMGGMMNLKFLSLGQNNLTGLIPAEIGQLMKLQTIDFNTNNLTGNIPVTLTNLVKLNTLSLSSNKLSGTIPAGIGNLLELKALSLANNEFSGSIPSELGRLVNLVDLKLFNNQLDGGIPDELGSLMNLKFLWLHSNRIAGSLPASLGGLTQLEQLSLEFNQLTGDVPATFVNLVRLKYFNISNNKLSGDLPASATELKTARIENNQFTFSNLLSLKGAILPDGIFSYSPQDSIDVKKEINPLINTVTLTTSIDRTTNPASVYQWFKYVDGINDIALNSPSINGHTFSFQTNNNRSRYYYKITNPSAPELTLVSRLQTVRMLNSSCSSTLEEEYQALMAFYQATNNAEGWSNKTGWQNADPSVVQSVVGWYGVETDASGHVIGLSMDGNNLTGAVPNVIGNLRQLQKIYLPNNKLSGNLPEEIFSLGCLQVLDISGNDLSGELSDAVAGLKSLKKLILSGNDLSGTIPEGVSSLTNLTFLHLSNNQFDGGLPASLGSLSNLESLDISNNPIGGSIPASFGDLHNLVSIFLDNCQLEGPIPAEIAGMQNLITLSLINNRLNVIPVELGNLTRLRTLILNYNLFSGNFPSAILQLSDLQVLNLGNNQFTGPIPAEISSLSALQFLALGSNGFSGAIPPELGSLSGLYVLYLNNNRLSGAIPSEIGSLINLSALELQNNAFNSIPLTFKNLVNLQQLQLSNNQISGILPSTLVNIRRAQIQNNKLTFQSFLDLKNALSSSVNFIFAPQDSIDDSKLLSASVGASLTIATEIDRQTSTPSLYQWFKFVDGVNDIPLSPSPTESGHTITISDVALSDNGTRYYYKITNPNAPTLTLVSRLQTLNVSSRCQSTLEDEYQALIALYQLTAGAEWSNNDGWSAADPNVIQSISGWYGVTTNAEGHVISLQLNGNNLSGTLPDQMGSFAYLENLNLSNNHITGFIPATIGNLCNLLSLQLSNNSVNGNLPSTIGDLTSLVSLHLNGNALSGAIPVGQLTNLNDLHTDSNQFTFSDIISIRQGYTGSVFTYAPQDSIGVKANVPIAGTDIILNAGVDTVNTDNVYQWYKYVDGTNDIPLSPGETVVIPDASNSDIGTRYYYKITNPFVSGLILVSHLHTIILSCKASSLLVLEFKSKTYLCAVSFTPLVVHPLGGKTVSYRWDFGDGATSAARSPLHPYQNHGNYNVSLTVNYTRGLCSGDSTITKNIAYDGTTETFMDTVINIVAPIKTEVINTSAVTFADAWALQHEAKTASKNSFLNGSQGVWRNDASYIYEAVRSRSGSANVGQDGTFTLENFNWPAAELNAIPHWIKANTMTAYSPFSYELENRDVLGNYSGAIYDYGGHLPAATGVNMRHKEMAFTSFEFLDGGAAGNWIFGTQPLPDNSLYTVKSANSFIAVVESSLEELEKVDVVDIVGIKRGVFGKRSFNYLTDVNIICRQAYELNSHWTVLVFDREVFNTVWAGFIVVKNKVVPAITPDIDNVIAHSGKSSLKVAVEKTYPQELIKLDSGKSYFVNAWVSVNNPYVKTPSLGSNLGYDIIIKDQEDVINTVFSFEPAGKIIEGWQQVKGTFICPINNAKIEVKFKSGTTGAWYDDLRIHPENGNMKAYVYDLKDYRLSAILDEENFAAYFYYDVEGNLYLTKKETVEGVKTISENISHRVENK